MRERLPKKWDYETEVAVIGAGAAGPAVAISAHSAGAKVLILERMDEPGGDMALSAGIVYAAGTSIQRELGIEDSADRMYKLYMAAVPHSNRKERERLKTICEGSAEVIDWLLGLGVKIPAVMGTPGLSYSGLEHLPEYAQVVSPVPGAHMCEGEGKGIQDILMKEVKRRGIDLLTRTRGRELMLDSSGEIIGLRAERDGTPIHIRAKRGVVICSGHFAHNKKLIELYCPKYADFATYTAIGLEGDGLIMAQAVGAAVANISEFRVNVGMVYEPGKALYVYRWCPCVLVNKQGRRFINDHAGYDPLAKAILEQEGGMGFVIFDEATRKNVGNNLLMPPLSPDLSREVEVGLAKRADTFRALAEKIDVDPAALENTLMNYNENARLGKDPEFGSTHFLEPISHPPFYAIKCEPTISAPTGGLDTDLDARVLDVFGRAIPRLYAVGTAASLCPGYPGGGANMVSIFHLGRIAGRHAAVEPLRRNRK